MVSNTRTRVVVLAAVVLAVVCASGAEDVHWSAAEKPLADQIDSLRALPDEVRADATKNLAASILRLPATGNKLRLATSLAGMSTLP